MENLWIPHTAAPEATRQQIRSIAATASASLRIATTARRRAEKDPLFPTTSTSLEDLSKEEPKARPVTRRRRPGREKTTRHEPEWQATGIIEPPKQPMPQHASRLQRSTFLLDFALSLRADGSQLCAAICNNSALWQSFALLIKTVWIYNPEQAFAPDLSSPLTPLLKDYALRSVQAILTSQVSDTGPLAAATAVLAAWEIRYGSEEESEVHSNACKTALGPRSPWPSNTDVRGHMLTLSDKIFHGARGHCRMVASSKVAPLYERPSPLLNPRFSIFRPIDAGMLGVFDGLSQLTRFDFTAHNALPRLREIGLEIFLATVPEAASDNAMLYCLHHVRNAVCALVGRFYGDPRISSQVEFVVSMGHILEQHMAKIRALGLRDFEMLIGTAYQEISFWALWTLSASLSLWDNRTLEVLKQYQQTLGIETWDDLEATLSRYAYPEEHLGPASHAMFEDLASTP